MTAGLDVPTLPGLPLLGQLTRLQDPLALFMRAAALGDVSRFNVGRRQIYLLRAPEHVKHVLQDNYRNYTKQTRGYAAMRALLGDGLVTSEGDRWLRQRRIAQPAFHRQRISHFGAVMVRFTEELAARWEPLAKQGAALDISDEMMALTLRIAGQTLLSADVSEDAQQVRRGVSTGILEIAQRVRSPLTLPLYVPSPPNRRLLAARRTLDAVVYRIIHQRRASPGEGGDLLAMLMQARDEETGEGMSDVQLRDEVMTLFLAGHETTANALSWTLYLLSLHPAVAQRLQVELRSALGGRSPTVEDLPKLPYTAQVVSESMRLYPPVWVVMRRCEADDEVAGLRLRKGNFVVVSSYVSHRNPRYFENPEGFDPERFSPARAPLIPRFAYFPFLAGPRICIGNTFAQMEAALVLATLLQRFRLDLVPGHPVVPEPAVTLRPRFGLQMTVHPQRRAE